MKNIAIILAGGSGSRFGSDIAKQLIKINNKTILEHTIIAFASNKHIDEIALVCKQELVDEIAEIAKPYDKIKHLLVGGKERYDSSLAAIRAYESESEDCNLLIHDAVRPLVSSRIIDDCVEALSKYNAAITAIKTTDTIIAANENNEIESILTRSLLRNVQTPQAFRLSIIKQAYALGLQDPCFAPTDDASVIRMYLPNEPVYIVEGEPTNIKITYKQDIAFLQSYLTSLQESSLSIS